MSGQLAVGKRERERERGGEGGGGSINYFFYNRSSKGR